MNYPIVMFLTIVLIAGCTEDKNNPIHCNLYIRYEADGDQVTAEADFSKKKQDGTFGTFVPKGGVSFMSSNMDSQNLPNGKKRFSYKFNGHLPSSLVLAWNGPDAKKSTIAIDGLSNVNFDLNNEQEENYVLKFDRLVLEKNETLVMLFTDSKNIKKNKEIKVGKKSSSISIPKSELSDLTKGKALLSLVIIRNGRIQRPDCDCVTSYSYYSTTEEIVL